MDEEKTGGPAFPVSVFDSVDGQTKIIEGATLRDYFAAKAMQGILANPESEQRSETFVSGFAFKVADAMLKAREEL